MNTNYLYTHKPNSPLFHIKDKTWFFVSIASLVTLFFCSSAICQTSTPTPTPAPPSLPAPTLVFPPKDATIQFPGESGLVYFSWEPVENVTEYMINVTVKSIPKIYNTKLKETSVYLNLSLKSTDIGATVSWSVVSVSGTVLSKASISKFILVPEGTPIPTPIPSVTPTPLPPPILYIPEDHANFSALDQEVLFSWSDVTGASSYKLSVYKDNDLFYNWIVKNPPWPFQFQQQTYVVLQWEVQTIDALGHIGYRAPRRSFSIGGDYLPTPTPLPLTADIDNNGEIDVLDLYQFANRYATNDPKTDLDQTGVTTSADLLHFLELFVERSR